jgi:hypothetical protein
MLPAPGAPSNSPRSIASPSQSHPASAQARVNPGALTPQLQGPFRFPLREEKKASKKSRERVDEEAARTYFDDRLDRTAATDIK